MGVEVGEKLEAEAGDDEEQEAIDEEAMLWILVVEVVVAVVVVGGLAAAAAAGGTLLRVVPARELRCVGRGCECSPLYETTYMLGSAGHRSTCFLAVHPFEVLHL